MFCKFNLPLFPIEYEINMRLCPAEPTFVSIESSLQWREETFAAPQSFSEFMLVSNRTCLLFWDGVRFLNALLLTSLVQVPIDDSHTWIQTHCTQWWFLHFFFAGFDNCNKFLSGDADLFLSLTWDWNDKICIFLKKNFTIKMLVDFSSDFSVC